MSEKLFPVFFAGHGSPMNIIANNEFSHSLQKLGENLPKPDAILVISAHWLTRGTFISTAEKPETIYDFYGFPEALYQIKYPAAGSPETAEKVIRLLGESMVKRDRGMGLDHGAWAVLHHMYPKADVPVLQLSLDAEKPSSYHFEMGKKLKALRGENILLLGSGNIVHSFRGADFQNEISEPYEWSSSFDKTVENHINNRDFLPLVDYQKLGQPALLSIPTPDHYWPLLYVLGASDDSDSVSYPFTAIHHKTMSMRSVLFS